MARVLMFGRLAERAGWRERSLGAGSLAELRLMLAEVLDGQNVATAVNGDLVRDADRGLNEHDEVAFMPPMSGG